MVHFSLFGNTSNFTNKVCILNVIAAGGKNDRTTVRVCWWHWVDSVQPAT